MARKTPARKRTANSRHWLSVTAAVVVVAVLACHSPTTAAASQKLDSQQQAAANGTQLTQLSPRLRAERVEKWQGLHLKFTTMRTISDAAYYVLLVIYSLFVLFGSIGNLAICGTALLRPQTLTPRTIFIVNLAVSDLLLCVFTMPVTFVELSHKAWNLGTVPCKLVGGLQATSIFVSTICVTAIAVDRYKVIVYAAAQQRSAESNRAETRQAAALLLLVWLGALLLSLPLFLFRKVSRHLMPMPPDLLAVQQQLLNSSGAQLDLMIGFCHEQWPFLYGRAMYSVVSMIVQYVLPISIVSVAYSRIGRKLNKRLERRQRLTALEGQQLRQKHQIKRTHAMLTSVSIIFALSWLPLNVLNVSSDFVGVTPEGDRLYRVLFAVCHLIGCSSACSNPVLYGYLNESFRREFEAARQRVCRLLEQLPCCDFAASKRHNPLTNTAAVASVQLDSQPSTAVSNCQRQQQLANCAATRQQMNCAPLNTPEVPRDSSSGVQSLLASRERRQQRAVGNDTISETANESAVNDTSNGDRSFAGGGRRVLLRLLGASGKQPSVTSADQQLPAGSDERAGEPTTATPAGAPAKCKRCAKQRRAESELLASCKQSSTASSSQLTCSQSLSGCESTFSCHSNSESNLDSRSHSMTSSRNSNFNDASSNFSQASNGNDKRQLDETTSGQALRQSQLTTE